ncbi:MAG: DUF2924 domain-containing protein [Pirellulaceae bacterium]|jgi:hypothetical protein|nr:DUF2924 domain-containing protein [Pirellulaceae bacterium]HJN13338.1 DUF2924 domain-containing protein [Pirellulaceae bacterium]
MELNVGKEIAALKRMTVGELRERYAEVFSEETLARNKQWLVKRIIWRLQSMSEGNLSERARTRAAELANDADLRRRPPKESIAKTKPVAQEASSDRRLPIPGTLITREYKGELLEVRVRPDGFDYEGDIYKSLSAMAKHITGSHCNGYHFFRLNKKDGDQ